MWKSIKQELYVHRSFLGWLMGISAAAWVLGVVIMTVVLSVIEASEGDCFFLGTILVLAIGMIVGIIGGASMIYQGFDDAIHMGKTRKRFLPSIALVIFLDCLVCFAMAGILARLEIALYGRLFPDLHCEGPVNLLTPAWILCYSVAAAGLSCGAGGMIKADRKIGGFICLAIWLSFWWSIGGVGGIDEEERGFFSLFNYLGYAVGNWYGNLAVGIRMGILLLIGIAGYLLMYALLIKRAAD